MCLQHLIHWTQTVAPTSRTPRVGRIHLYRSNTLYGRQAGGTALKPELLSLLLWCPQTGSTSPVFLAARHERSTSTSRKCRVFRTRLVRHLARRLTDRPYCMIATHCFCCFQARYPPIQTVRPIRGSRGLHNSPAAAATPSLRAPPTPTPPSPQATPVLLAGAEHHRPSTRERACP